MVDLVIRPTIGAGNKIIIQDQAGQPVLTTADSGGTLNNVTVPTGPGFKEFNYLYYNLATVSTAMDTDNISICGSGTTAGVHHLVVTPGATADIIQFGWSFCWYNDEGYMGWGIQMSTTNNFASGNSTLWATGRDQVQGGDTAGSVADWGGQAGGVLTDTASTFGMSADTTYYVRMVGQTFHNSSWTSNSAKWGYEYDNDVNGVGVRLSMQRWSTT